MRHRRDMNSIDANAMLAILLSMLTLGAAFGAWLVRPDII